MKKNTLIIFLFLFPLVAGIAEQINKDSLFNAVKKLKNDTLKIAKLNSLFAKAAGTGDYVLGDSIYKLSLQISQSLNYKLGIATALSDKGDICWFTGDFSQALKYELDALAIFKNINDTIGVGNSYGNLGAIYKDLGNYSEALKYQYMALRIDEALKNKPGLAIDYTNIGNVYQVMGNNDQALKNAQMALHYDEQDKDTVGLAADYGNMGIIYKKLKKYDEAIVSQTQSLNLCKKVGDKQGVALAYANMGTIYNAMKKFQESLNCQSEAKKIAEELGDKSTLSITLLNLSEVYANMHQPAQAYEYLNKGLALALQVGNKEYIEAGYYNRAKLDSSKGDFRAVYRDFKQHMNYHDSLLNDETAKKTMQSQMQYSFSHQQDSIKSYQDKKDAIVAGETKRQTIITWSVVAGFLLVLTLAGFIFRGYKLKQRANLLLEEQKRKIDEAYGELHEKHKEITDSINYAKRIQDALFKDEEYVTKHLPEHFIFFKPRDVVSGDFYWGHEREGYWFIAAVDCTGHGVPGAFLTMLGSAFLNEICATGDVPTPAEILNRLRDKIVKELSGHGDVKDGMDLSLCRINMQTKEVHWSGANNPLWYIQNGELKEINADKQPIGYQQGQKPFTNYIIHLAKNDMLYLFTDGYADQFGGPKGKKFKYKSLSEKLKTIYEKSLEEQKKVLDLTLQEWKGALEQVDDILIIGIRV